MMQDVFEHIFNPFAALAEIKRTLKPGGGLIMTVPVVRNFEPSRRRAALTNGLVDHLLPAEYHGNPVSGSGSLVTIDWGFDIVAIFSKIDGMYFTINKFENHELGIIDENNVVIVGYRRELPEIDCGMA